MKKPEIIEILNRAEEKCIEAVEYVGVANYHERDLRALRWVRREFHNLKVALQSQLEENE